MWFIQFSSFPCCRIDRFNESVFSNRLLWTQLEFLLVQMPCSVKSSSHSCTCNISALCILAFPDQLRNSSLTLCSQPQKKCPGIKGWKSKFLLFFLLTMPSLGDCFLLLLRIPFYCIRGCYTVYWHLWVRKYWCLDLAFWFHWW